MTTNTYTTSTAKGNREDLTDVIYRISPTVTPFISLAAKGKATNTLHQWQTQDLASNANNALAEGADASNKVATPTTLLTNYTQISGKAISVSGTQRAMNPAGRSDELAYQMSLISLELRRDVETGLLQNDVAVTTSPRQSRGLPGWIVDNVSNNGGALASYTGNTGRTLGTQRAFTEAQVKSVLQAVFTAGGNPDTILLPPAAKQTFSGFTGNATRMDKSEDAKLYSAVDFYVSDFGTLSCLPSRFQSTRDVFILESEKWAVSYLRPWQVFDIAKQGDADNKQMVVEYTLEARAPKANGAIYDVL